MCPTPDLQMALCEAQPAETPGFALGGEIALAADGQAPEWVELLPAGDPLISPRDGRQWRNPDPAAVVAETRARKLLPIPIDLDHASEIAPADRRGVPAPAVGWIEEIAERAGAVWARVSWTEKGAEMVRNREFRYLSPAFAHTREDRRVLFISSGALVNKPAFPQLALNAANPEPEISEMDKEQRKALCAALGLAETATDAEIVAAAEKLKGERERALASAKAPSLDEYVPRADYNAQVEKATAAEQKLAEHEATALNAAIDAEIEAALKAKKITPATAEYHKAQCRAEGGLERFREFVKHAPEVAAESGLDHKRPEGGGGEHGLTEQQLAICNQMGLTPEQYKQAQGDPG